MDFELIWAEPAAADLEAAIRYVAKQDPTTAEKLRVELLESVEILTRFPLIGPVYERDQTGRTREITCRQYRIFYRFQEE